MKILFIASELPPTRSGVALACGKLIDGYRRHGYTVDVIKRMDFPFWVVGEFRLSSVLFYWHKLRGKLGDYDIIHLHGPAPTFIDVFLFMMMLAPGKFKHTSLVYTHQFDIDLPYLSCLGKFYNLLNKWIAGLVCDSIVVTTHAYKKNFGRYSDIYVIPWGCDHRGLNAPFYMNKRMQGSRLKVLFIGQMRPYKGLQVLLKALVGLEGVDARIVGSGRLLEHYKAVSKELGLITVEFLGGVLDEELDNIFLDSHVVVLPSVSRTEAFGIVLLEGMRTGCIPVASLLPGVDEVVGDAGFLFTPGDHNRLREILCSLKNDMKLREKLSVSARERSNSFLWEETIKNHCVIFENLLRNKGRK